MPDLRFLSSRHDGSRPQRAGVVPPRPQAIALPRAMENESRLRRVGRVHRLSESDEGLGLVPRETAQKPDDEGEIRGVQRKCAVFCASWMLDRRFTRGIASKFDSRRLHFERPQGRPCGRGRRKAPGTVQVPGGRRT
jgi:hypothetical protein